MTSTYSPVLEALALSALGMSVVFLFLSCLVGALWLLRFIKPEPATDSATSPSLHNQRHDSIQLTQKRKRAAAIAVACHERQQH